jgi:hypothetical protein
MARGDVQLTIERLLQTGDELSTRDVAARAGVSRQAAQKQLKAMVAKGTLTVHGKARAAKYKVARRVDALWAKVAELSQALMIAAPPSGLHAQAQFAIPLPAVTAPQFGKIVKPPPAPVVETKRQRLEVASAGALFRLSARLLLDGVEADELTLDFNGVEDLGDEFLEEVFGRWAEAHPDATIQIVNLAPQLVERLQPYKG